MPESAVKPLSLDVSEQLEGMVPESTVRPLTPCPNRSSSLEVSEQLEGIVPNFEFCWISFRTICRSLSRLVLSRKDKSKTRKIASRIVFPFPFFSPLAVFPHLSLASLVSQTIFGLAGNMFKSNQSRYFHINPASPLPAMQLSCLVRLHLHGIFS